MNTISKEIGMLFKDGKAQEANAAKEQSTQLKENIKVFTSRLSEIESELHKLLVQIPRNNFV